MRSIAAYGKIGTQKRADLWGADKKTLEGAPGPGQHTQSFSSFSGAKTMANFHSGRKETQNSNPGPGQYDSPEEKMTLKGSMSQRFN